MNPGAGAKNSMPLVFAPVLSGLPQTSLAVCIEENLGKEVG